MTKRREYLDLDILTWHEERSRPLTEIEERPVDWLWEGFIPRSMLTLVTGLEGLGKSQLTLKIAAEFSRGTFGDEYPGVKLYTAEDPLAQVLKPRMVANRANLKNVMVEGIGSELWLPKGLKDIEKEVAQTDIGFVVIDPVIAYFGQNFDSNKAQDVRIIMRGLAEIAEKYDVVIIGVTHPKKGEETSALHKLIGGSAAFGQAARSVLGVCAHPDKEDQRIVGRIKGNLNKPPTPVAYEILSHEYTHKGQTIKTSKVETRGKVGLDQYEYEALMVGLKKSSVAEDRRTLKDEAVLFITTQLSHGPVAWSELKKRGEPYGLTSSTLQAAGKELEAEGQVQRGVEWSWRG